MSAVGNGESVSIPEFGHSLPFQTVEALTCTTAVVFRKQGRIRARAVAPVPTKNSKYRSTKNTAARDMDTRRQGSGLPIAGIMVLHRVRATVAQHDSIAARRHALGVGQGNLGGGRWALPRCSAAR